MGKNIVIILPLTVLFTIGVCLENNDTYMISYSTLIMLEYILKKLRNMFCILSSQCDYKTLSQND